ncbi:hypothetical protein NKG94_40935 [Micromonospora sp. M12]
MNNSPNNTGLTNLPPVVPATVDYGYAGDARYPEIGGGGARWAARSTGTTPTSTPTASGRRTTTARLCSASGTRTRCTPCR